MFQHKAAHLLTWYSNNPSDSTQHQSDHTIVKKRDIKSVQDTWVFRGADVESDHRLVISKLQLDFGHQPNTAFIHAFTLLPFALKKAGAKQLSTNATTASHTLTHPYH